MGDLSSSKGFALDLRWYRPYRKVSEGSSLSMGASRCRCREASAATTNDAKLCIAASRKTLGLISIEGFAKLLVFMLVLDVRLETW